jgi:chorismate mutase/prephenate dehydratase
MTSTSPPPANDTAALAPLRQQIDALDQQLLALLNQRALLAEQVGEIKKHVGSPFFRPDRVAQLIARLQQRNPGPLRNEHVAAVWREIVSACLALESPIRIAYLGPAGTFSEQAALQYFGSSIGRVACASFDEVFRAASSGMAEFGVVPLENSTEGVVARTLDLLLTSPLHIVGEVSLMVRHHLLRSSDSLEGIEVVCAHPQALAQCHNWLSTQLPHAERRAVSSNAEGARLAAEHPSWAGIASLKAATEFGLHSVAHGIQDVAVNRTRFAVVCLPSVLDLPPPSGDDRISLVVSVPNRSGALHDLLVPLKKHGVSMTRFESRPAKSGQWDYYFYIDLQGHPEQPHVRAALDELAQYCAFCKILGTHAVSRDA